MNRGYGMFQYTLDLETGLPSEDHKTHYSDIDLEEGLYSEFHQGYTSGKIRSLRGQKGPIFPKNIPRQQHYDAYDAHNEKNHLVEEVGKKKETISSDKPPALDWNQLLPIRAPKILSQGSIDWQEMPAGKLKTNLLTLIRALTLVRMPCTIPCAFTIDRVIGNYKYRSNSNVDDFLVYPNLGGANTDFASLNAYAYGQEQVDRNPWSLRWSYKKKYFAFCTRRLLTLDFDEKHDFTKQDVLRVMEYVGSITTPMGWFWVVHETDRGMHAYLLSHKVEYYWRPIIHLMRLLCTDPYYVALLFKDDKGWCMRLSPKIDNPDDFVVREKLGSSVTYSKDNENRSTCDLHVIKPFNKISHIAPPSIYTIGNCANADPDLTNDYLLIVRLTQYFLKLRKQIVDKDELNHLTKIPGVSYQNETRLSKLQRGMDCADSETIMKLRAAVDRIYNGIQKDKFNYFVNCKAKRLD